MRHGAVDSNSACVVYAAYGEQLVSVLLLGEVSKYAFFMVSFPAVGSSPNATWMEDGEPRQDPEAKASSWVASRPRRVFECVVAALALLALSPLLAVCWILVRCTSPGAVFFRQWRMGRDGQEFELYKFRSMRCDSHGGGASHTVLNDLRITRVGALLRRYKLDELPQFWNVLKGDMSLVGPRPKLPHHELLHMPYRPGITGHATLAFRHEERMLLEVPSDEIDLFYEVVVKQIKAQLDIEYMERATFLSDLKVMARTTVRCLNSRADARRELRELLDRYASHHLDRLAPQRNLAPVMSVRPSNLVPELTEELAGDLDDAA